MGMRDFEGNPLPEPGGSTVVFVSPGGVACKPFAEGYLTMRVCLGNPHDVEDGLEVQLDRGWEPIPWETRAVRDDALAELRRRASGAEGDARSRLVRLIEHVRRTPYYEST